MLMDPRTLAAHHLPDRRGVVAASKSFWLAHSARDCASFDGVESSANSGLESVTPMFIQLFFRIS